MLNADCSALFRSNLAQVPSFLRHFLRAAASGGREARDYMQMNGRARSAHRSTPRYTARAMSARRNSALLEGYTCIERGISRSAHNERVKAGIASTSYQSAARRYVN